MIAGTDHEGRRYLVVGGARGIGLTFARMARSQGARVCIVDRDESALQAVNADKPFAGTLACDVCDAGRIDDVVAQAAAMLGGLDGLIYSAGIDLQSPVDAMADDDWYRVMDINLAGPMRFARAATSFLKNGEGDRCIINVSSAAGLSPLMDRSAYCVSKAGLNMFGKCLAQELGADGIRVVTVAPGAVDTPLLHQSYENAPDPAQALDAIRARYALRRIASAEDIAATMLFLCGPGAHYITGTTIAVDGGRSFH